MRFPDVLTRMHSATKPQVLGLLAVIAGVGLRLQDARCCSIGLLVLVVVLRPATSPIARHMVGRAAFREGQVGSYLVADELSDAFPARRETQGS